MSDRSKARKRRSRIIVLLIVVVAVAAPIIWHKCIQYKVLPRNFGVVVEGQIYRSGQNSGWVVKRLCEDLQLKTIIDLGGTDGRPEGVAEQAAAVEMGVTRFAFGMPGDGTGDPNRWAAVLELMSDTDRYPMLVHCWAGAQRSTTAVLLYEHFVNGRPIQEAYPDSFDFKHKPDEWELVAYLADHIGEIEIAYRTGMTVGDSKPKPISEVIRKHQINPPPGED